ncbi:hypothetical protein GN958_ATG14709 [Phytophthora infestans]|uniref:Uncharacterized protein n=1 Tax=Phytophthora infestans TaxID=4787 RepID=A0A8S9U759_PHYIN|nr:hypothetical protein GN958_ATG14709 [Phytophthora infestans]
MFMAKNSMIQIVKSQMPGSLKGPVTLPHETMSKMGAMKAMLHLLKKAGITPGPFAAIQNAQMELFKTLRALVGESRTQLKIESKPAVGRYDPLDQGGGGCSLNSREGDSVVSTGLCDEGGSSSTMDDQYRESQSKLSTLFNPAMECVLSEQSAGQETHVMALPRTAEKPDVEMESVGSHHGE